MNNFKQLLKSAGIICFVLAVFQAIIGFSPSLSLYFGAPESLVQNIYVLIFASFLIAGVLAIFGFYALSGAGSIKRLPLLRPALIVISTIFILRGLLLIPEVLVIAGTIESSIPVAMRFVIFSAGALMIGLIFTIGTIAGWDSLSAAHQNSSR